MEPLTPAARALAWFSRCLPRIVRPCRSSFQARPSPPWGSISKKTASNLSHNPCRRCYCPWAMSRDQSYPDSSCFGLLEEGLIHSITSWVYRCARGKLVSLNIKCRPEAATQTSPLKPSILSVSELSSLKPWNIRVSVEYS